MLAVSGATRTRCLATDARNLERWPVSPSRGGRHLRGAALVAWHALGDNERESWGLTSFSPQFKHRLFDAILLGRALNPERPIPFRLPHCQRSNRGTVIVAGCSSGLTTL
jgi:hypothetical protein